MGFYWANKFPPTVLFLTFLFSSHFLFAKDLPSFGRYVGVVRYRQLNKVEGIEPIRDQLAKLDFVVVKHEGNLFKLLAILTLHFGDFLSREYISINFNDVTYDTLTDKMVLADSDQFFEVSDVSLENQTLVGKITLPPDIQDVEASLILGSDKPFTPQFPLVPQLAGEYFGRCFDRDQTISITTSRWIGMGGPGAGLYGIYKIYGLRGQPNADIEGMGYCIDFVTRKRRPCISEVYTGGDFNFYSSLLSLTNAIATLECKVNANGLFCDPCVFNRVYKPWTKSPACFIDGEPLPVYTPPQSRCDYMKVAHANSGHEAVGDLLSDESTGVYVGHLHHEFTDEYQKLTIQVRTSKVFVSNGARSVKLTVTANLSFIGNPRDTLHYRFPEQTLPADQSQLVLHNRETNAILQITSMKKGVISGHWFARSFGRVGVFEVYRDKQCPTPPKLPISTLMGNYGGRILKLRIKTNTLNANQGPDPYPGEEYRIHTTRPVDAQSDRDGSYTSRAECEGDLVNQKALFTQETGLEPVTAFCYSGIRLQSHAWVFRIDGFGKPKKKMMLYEELIPPSWSTERIQIQSRDYVAAMKKHGFAISRAFISRDFDERLHIQIRYYGNAPVTFRRQK
jgi:hypothetical protein